MLLPRNVVVLIAALLVACLLGGCDSTDTEEGGQGKVRVLLTDAPLDEIVEAHVVIERVELLTEGEGTVVLTDEAQPFDLLTLQDGLTVTLADTEVPAETYHQVRLIVGEAAEVVYLDGTREELKVPSGTQTGIKVLLPPFEVDESEDLIVITLDFDVRDSFVEAGNSGKVLFKPVIKPLALVVNGENVLLD